MDTDYIRLRTWYKGTEKLITLEQSTFKVCPEYGDYCGNNRPNLGAAFKFHDALETDKGNYTCKLISTNNEEFTISYILDKKIPPHVEAKNANNTSLVVMEGERVNLTCNINGYPSPDKTWYKVLSINLPPPHHIYYVVKFYLLHLQLYFKLTNINENLISKEDPKYSINDDGTLEIKHAELDETEKYVCVGSNIHGAEIISITLIVARTSKVITNDTIFKFEVGSSVIMPCVVDVS